MSLLMDRNSENRKEKFEGVKGLTISCKLKKYTGNAMAKRILTKGQTMIAQHQPNVKAGVNSGAYPAPLVVMKEKRTGLWLHLWHIYSVMNNQFMVAIMKLSNWWLQPNRYQSRDEPQILEYCSNWEIYLPYTSTVGMLFSYKRNDQQNHETPSDIGNLRIFSYSVKVLWLTSSHRLKKCLTFQSFFYERTWWRFSKKHAVRTTFCGALVAVLAPSAVDRGFQPRSGQTKDHKLCMSGVRVKSG